MATILCIEDEEHIREDICELMENAGHKALQACDGKAGLEMIVEHKPDLVVSDITMPTMDGRELLTEVREKYPKFASMPFIFLSALADRDDVLDGMKLGADDYLTKPIDFEMLANKVEASLRQVERMQAQKEQQFVKLFNALSGDAGTGRAAAPTADAKPEIVESAVPEKLQEPTTPASEETRQRSGNDKPRRTIFGTVFQFDNIGTTEDQTESQRKGFVDWLQEKTCSFFNKVLPAKDTVTTVPNGSVLVCYRDGDRDNASKQSKQLARQLEDHLQQKEVDEFAQKTSISKEMLAHWFVVTESLYETELALEDLAESERFSAAIKEQAFNISADKSAPTRLAASIKHDKGHLVPLTLFGKDGGALPLKFFNYDDKSRQKIGSSFALFGKENKTKAGYLVDLLTLEYLEQELENLKEKDIIVVDIHFMTLINVDYIGLYLPKILKFVEAAPNRVMINVRAIPPDTTSFDLNEILLPFGKHAARRIVQISPKTIEAHASAQLPVSSIVLTYSEMMQASPDCSLFRKAKQQLSEAGTLLVLRGLPSQDEIAEFSEYGFDGFAVACA